MRWNVVGDPADEIVPKAGDAARFGTRTVLAVAGVGATAPGLLNCGVLNRLKN
jgi:hypothetical protein